MKTWRLPQDPHGALQNIVFRHEPETLDQTSGCLPSGVYTTFRTYSGNRAIRFDDHCARLRESAALAFYPVPCDCAAIRGALREILSISGSGDKRIRVTLDLETNPGDVYISVEPLRVPPNEAYEQGVAVLTRDLWRSNPKAKLTNFISAAAGIRADLPAGVHEALMVAPDGEILEGLSSNFFAVQKGIVWTAEIGVLDGITRRLAIEEAELAGISVHRQGIHLSDIDELDEAFLTSSSRGILPVVKIDEKVIGNRLPGALTKILLLRLSKRIGREAEIL